MKFRSDQTGSRINTIAWNAMNAADKEKTIKADVRWRACLEKRQRSFQGLGDEHRKRDEGGGLEDGRRGGLDRPDAQML